MKETIANRFIVAAMLLAIVGLIWWRSGHPMVPSPLGVENGSTMSGTENETRSDKMAGRESISEREKEPAAVLPDGLSAPAKRPDPAEENEAILARFDSRVMNDPEFETFLRNRLWLALDGLNNPLVKSLNLTPAEQESFKRIIVEDMVHATEQAGGTMDQGVSAAETVFETALRRGQSEVDRKLYQLLGEARYGQYEAYRNDFSQFNRIKFLDGRQRLTDDQAEQVLAVMVAERQIVMAAVQQVEADAGQPASPAERDDEIQAAIDREVYNKVKAYLSPDQFAAFSRF